MEDFEEIETPIIPYDSVQLGRIGLTWFNSTLRVFKEPVYDHVRYRHDDGRAFAFVPTTEVQSFMLENDYPLDYRPVVDSITKGWYVGHVAMIFNEIDEIFKEGD